MTDQPNRLDITPGEARVKPNSDLDGNCVFIGKHVVARSYAWEGDKATRKTQWIANANLIADAHNTANATGKLPSELAAEVERLREALSRVLMFIEEDGYGFEETCKRVARAALAGEED